MANVREDKCVFYDTGYCKFSKTNNGCKKVHPRDICTIKGCKRNVCPNRHPRMCKFGEKCTYRTKCSYSHVHKMGQESQNNELLKNVNDLTKEVCDMKEENKSKTNALNTALEDMKALNKVVDLLKTEISVIKGNNASKLRDLRETVENIVAESDQLKILKAEIAILKSENKN